MEKSYYTSAEIAKGFISVGIHKTENSAKKQFAYAFMAGIFLALVCQSTNVATHMITSVGISKTLAGVIFPTGLILIVLAGTELFTGNCLIAISCLCKKVKWIDMAKNLVVVYFGNFVGSLVIVGLILASGQLGFSGGALGAYTIKVAVGKVGMDFIPALVMGILCNIMVCAAVWIAASAGDVAGKILAMFFPIWVFVISGFEHSVANMYYIPAGILAKTNPDWANMATEMFHVSQEGIANLNWGSMIVNNLIPVTIGNIIGGAVFIGFMYWLIHLKGKDA